VPPASNAAPSYHVAVSQLLALGHELHATPSRKFDLANMRVLLQVMGHPERRFQSVLIAGTNGKGSTAATLYSILAAAGYKAGLYTSPHLIRINERIRTHTEDGEISDAEFAEIHTRIEACSAELLSRRELPWHPSFFEILTAMAFEYFASTGIEIGVLEVGMGGRLDATNVVDPCISVITDVALDHQAFLGNTLGEIAREKAGIIRPNGTVVTLPQHPEATDVIGRAILENHARAVDAVPYMPPVSPGASQFQESDTSTSGEARSERLASRERSARAKQRSVAEPSEKSQTSYQLDVLGNEIKIQSPLIGRHQYRNLALAIATAVELKNFGFPLTPQQIETGIRNTRWPGRFQILPATSVYPEIVLDVAHNPAGAWALRAALSQYYEGRPLILIFGAMADKAIGEISEILFPLSDCVIVTAAQTPRAATPEAIRQAAARTDAQIIREPSITAALERARILAVPRKNPAIVITGSIYVVGEALQLLRLHRSL
jgi:dihydrofolate synthase/folylpolyglutamate synthase